jgi:predicted nucleic acid-binding protein
MSLLGAAQMVVDTSAVLAVLISEPVRPAVLEATRSATLLAASSLPWEVGNALVALRRRRLVTAADVQRAWSAFMRVPVRYVEIRVGAALSLAMDAGLCAYDGYAIEAARTARAPLLSLDRRQRNAARGLGIEIVEVVP